MDLIPILLVLTNLILCYGRPEVGLHYDPKFYEQEFHNNSLGKAHYNPWACDYRHEPGYTCLSCNKALHCYINNFALLVQCAGLFPYCRNGFCSMRKVDDCIEEPPHGVTTHSAVTSIHKNTTNIAHAESTTENTHVGDTQDGSSDKNKTVLSMENVAGIDLDKEESATDKVMYAPEATISDQIGAPESVATSRMYYNEPPSSSLYKIIKSFLGILG